MASQSSNSASESASAEGGELGFAIGGDGADTRLSLKEQTFFGWLHVEKLELEDPQLPPAKARQGGVEAFQRRRTRVTEIGIRVGRDALDEVVAGCGPELAELGTDELALRSKEGSASLVTRVREGRHAADLCARVYLMGSGEGVRLLIDEPRAFGFLPTPAPLLAHRLLLCLLGAEQGSPGPARARVLGLGDIEIQPVSGLLWRLFPPFGWRLPSTGGLTLSSISCDRNGIACAFDTEGEPIGGVESAARTPESAARASALARALESYRDADAKLLSGDATGALRAYRGELAARGPEDLFAIERILAITASNRDLFGDADELARQALGRWPEHAPGHAALAAIAAAEGEGKSAAARFERLADALAEAGDDEGEVRACLAAGRLLREEAPEDATPIYERVLERSSDHPEATEALAERYTEEARWGDLVRLIRGRIAGTGDPQRRARDHLRLAQILADRLGDPASARAELELACDLDRAHPGPREALAQLELDLGHSERAHDLLEEAEELHAVRGDERGRARACRLAGALLEARGDTGAAEIRYNRALAASPGDPAAADGAARCADACGRHRAAAEIWGELAARDSEPPASRARYLALAGGALALCGDGAAARDALWRAISTGLPEIAAEARHRLAEMAARQGSLGEAAELLDRAVENDIEAADALVAGRRGTQATGRPDPATLRARAARTALELGETRAAVGDTDRAGEAYELAYELASDAETAARAALALRDRARTRGDPEAELAWLASALGVTEGEDRAELLLERAALERRQGRAEEAEETAREAEARGSADEVAKALALRAAICGDRGDLAGRADHLERREELVREPAGRADAAAEAAEARLEAGDTERALEAARRARDRAAALDADGDRDSERLSRAKTALGEAAWRGRAWEDVCRAYAELIHTIPSAASSMRALMAYRLGIAYEARGELESAGSALEVAVADEAAADDVRDAARRALAAVYENRGEPLAAAAALEAFARALTHDADEAARADALHRAGELRLEHGEGGAAEALFEEALRRCPDHLPALDALERLHRESGEIERLAVVLGRKIAATSAQPVRQRTLLCRLAELQDEQGRREVALESYERALELDPEYRPALRAIAQAARSSGDRDRAARAYDRLARVLRGDEQSSSGAEGLAEERIRAALCLVEIDHEAPGLGIHERALARVSENMTRSPGDERLLSALTALRARGKGEQPLGAAASPSRGAARKEGQADAVEGPAEALWARPDPTARGASARMERAENQGPGASKNSGPVGAGAAPQTATVTAAQPAESEAPSGAEAPSANERPGPDEDPASAKDRSPDEDPSPDEGPRSDEDPSPDKDPASAIDRGSDEGPSSDEDPSPDEGPSPDALRAEARAARARGDLLAAIETLARAAEHSSGEASLLREGAEVAAALGDPSEEIGWLEALAGAERSAAARGELYLEIADLSYDRLGDPERARRAMWSAADAFESGSRRDATLRLLATEASSQESDEEAIEALEALGWEALKPSERITLARCYRRAGRERRAIDVLEAERRSGELSEEGATMLFSLYRERKHKQALAASLERGADGASTSIAITRLREALQLYEEATGDEAAAARVRKRLEELENPAPGTASPRGTSPDQLEAAADAAAKTGETSVAANLWTRALAGRSTGPDGERQVAAVLERLRGSWLSSREPQIVAEALERAAGAELDRGAASLIFEEAAAQRRRAGDLEGAANNLERALARRPESGRLCRDLVATRAERGEPSQIAAACELHLTLAEGSARAWPLAVLAALSRRALGDPERAEDYEREGAEVSENFAGELEEAEFLVAAAERARPSEHPPKTKTAGGADGAADPFADILSADGRAARGAETAAPQAPPTAREDSGGAATAERSESDDEIAAAVRRAKALEADGHLDAAIASWEWVAQTEPGDLQALRALEWLYAETSDPQGLADTLARLAAVEDDPLERADLWYRRGKLYRDMLGEEAEAYRSFMEAHEAHPDDARVAYALRSVAIVRGEWELAASLIRREIAATPSRNEAGALHLEHGLICEEKLRDPGAAIASYERAIALDPDIPAARKPLARLYEIAGRHEDAARAFEDAAEVAADPDERAELLARAHTAFATLRNQADTEAGERAALSGIARTATRAGEIGPALAAAQELLERLPGDDVETVTSVRMQIAELHQRGGDVERAIEHLEMVRAEEPKSVAALSRLVHLHMERDDPAGAAQALQALIAITENPGQRGQLLFELGELYLTRLGDPEAAFDAHLKSADLDPQNPATLCRLVEHDFRAGDCERVLETADELAAQGALAESAPAPALARIAVAAAIARSQTHLDRALSLLGGAAAEAVGDALAEAASGGRLGEDLLGRAAAGLEAAGAASHDELAARLDRNEPAPTH